MLAIVTTLIRRKAIYYTQSNIELSSIFSYILYALIFGGIYGFIIYYANSFSIKKLTFLINKEVIEMEGAKKAYASGLLPVIVMNIVSILGVFLFSSDVNNIALAKKEFPQSVLIGMSLFNLVCVALSIILTSRLIGKYSNLSRHLAYIITIIITIMTPVYINIFTMIF